MFDSPADYDHSMAVYDGMDVNNSVLQLLPQGWTYDMEGTNLFTFSGNNVWFWGYDSSIGQANGVTSGTKPLHLQRKLSEQHANNVLGYLSSDELWWLFWWMGSQVPEATRC